MLPKKHENPSWWWPHPPLWKSPQLKTSKKKLFLTCCLLKLLSTWTKETKLWCFCGGILSKTNTALSPKTSEQETEVSQGSSILPLKQPNNLLLSYLRGIEGQWASLRISWGPIHCSNPSWSNTLYKWGNWLAWSVSKYLMPPSKEELLLCLQASKYLSATLTQFLKKTSSGAFLHIFCCK